jgi:hypothetical protein
MMGEHQNTYTNGSQCKLEIYFIYIEIDSLDQLGKLAKAVKEEGDDCDLYTEVFAWGSNHAG